MSSKLLKVLVVVLFAGGIITFVFYKSNGSSTVEPETEQMTEDEEVSNDTAESEEENEEVEKPESTEKPTETKTNPPKTDKGGKTIAPTPIDELIIPSSKSMVPVNGSDIHYVITPDTNKKRK